jgi:surfactin synthase thioesterase subunit
MRASIPTPTPLTWKDLQELQADAMADDVELDVRMLEWTRESALAFLESGGAEDAEVAAVRAAPHAYCSQGFHKWLSGLLPGIGMSDGLPGEGPTDTVKGINREVPCRPQARCRLLMFYGVADVAASLAPWQNDAPEWLEARVVELPGHGFRANEPVRLGDPLESLDTDLILSELRALASRLADEMSPLTSSAPYMLFGFSFGALVAFAVADELRRRAGRQPLVLLVAGRGAPHCVFMKRAELKLLATRGAEEVLRWTGDNWGRVNLTMLPPSRLPRAAQLFRSGGLLGGVPIGGVWEGDDGMLPAHVASPVALDVPIFAVGSSADRLWPAKLNHEWGRVTSRGFASVVLDGIEHNRLMNDPNLRKAVLREAAAAIAQHALQPVLSELVTYR